MKIGIYSGCFDPFTNGHLWVVQEGLKLFDELILPIGKNSYKQSTFTEQERVEMISACVPKRVSVTLLPQMMSLYVMGLEKRGNQVALLRGIRNAEDFEYEENILQNLRRVHPAISQIYVVPPEELACVSSSYVKGIWTRIGWESVKDYVPGPVLERIKEKHQRWASLNDNWREVRSIINETSELFPASATIGFLNAANKPASKERQFFGKMADNGFIKFAGKVTASQVRKMLDPFPVSVIDSDVFHLTNIPIDSVTPTGAKYLPRSHSLGPIIVDKKTDDLADYDVRGVLGECLVIEGKHRWFEAKERGDTHIWAWVGERALECLRQKAVLET